MTADATCVGHTLTLGSWRRSLDLAARTACGRLLGEHQTRKGGRGTNVIISREKENLSTRVMKVSEPCQVCSGTDDPCHRPACVMIGGTFLQACAREQEAYFAVGELTEEPRSPQDDERLVGLLDRMRSWMRRRRIRASSAVAA